MDKTKYTNGLMDKQNTKCKSNPILPIA